MSRFWSPALRQWLTAAQHSGQVLAFRFWLTSDDARLLFWE